MRHRRSALVLMFAIASTLAHRAAAQTPETAAAPDRSSGSLEIGTLRAWTSGSYGDWGGVYARLVSSRARDLWTAEARAQYAFGDRGVYGGLAYRRDLSSRVFADIGAGGSVGAFFFPRTRGDAGLGLRLGTRRELVSTLAVTALRYENGYRDIAATFALARYFRGLTGEIGGRLNRSSPGDVTSSRAFVAATFTPSPRRTFIARVDVGDEGYQLVGRNEPLVAFASRAATVATRVQITRSWAVGVSAEGYDNPFYSRVGVSAGVVRSW